MALRDLFSSQNLPLPDIEPRPINAGGILVEVWGMDKLSGDRDVAVMFFAHGRTRSKETMHGALRSFAHYESWMEYDRGYEVYTWPALGEGREQEGFANCDIGFEVRNQ